jgi:signal transduction histidine kinase
MRLIRLFENRTRGYTYIVSLALVLLLGIVDYVTGAEWAFSLFYLLPIALAAWVAGRTAGILVSIAAAVAWYVADVTQRTYPLPGIPLWNAGIRLAFFIIVTWALWALQESRAREQAAADQEEMLRQFIVHDLRGYLANILGGLGLLEMDVESGALGEQAEILRPMLASGQRMSILVDSLLDQARLESGQLQISTSVVDPQALVATAMQQQGLWAQLQGVTLTAQVDPGAGRVMADEALILRVLLNLLSNAIKASPRGSEITLRVVPDGNRQVAFSIADHGRGVPKEWAARVFDKYAQVEIRKARGTVGTGLGLTFCKLAVEAHGGCIWLASEPQQGSTVFFTLAQAAPATIARQEPATPV